MLLTGSLLIGLSSLRLVALSHLRFAQLAQPSTFRIANHDLHILGDGVTGVGHARGEHRWSVAGHCAATVNGHLEIGSDDVRADVFAPGLEVGFGGAGFGAAVELAGLRRVDPGHKAASFAGSEFINGECESFFAFDRAQPFSQFIDDFESADRTGTVIVDGVSQFDHVAQLALLRRSLDDVQFWFDSGSLQADCRQVRFNQQASLDRSVLICRSADQERARLARF